MPYELQFSPEQARLAELAIAYHLGRPGSELDPETLKPSSRGLRMAAGILASQRELAEAKVTLDAHQLKRLGEAMLQAISELKVLALAEAPWTPGAGVGHSVNVAFEEAAARLFPMLRNDPTSAHQVAGALMLLYRKLDRTLKEDATPAPEPRRGTGKTRPTGRWWNWWRRRSSRKNVD
jgi:hypothetical protein